MPDAARLRYLRIALIVFGLIFTFAIYPLAILWPSGWSWGQGHSHYLMMIIGVYATLGVFLLIASRDPPPSHEPDLVHRLVEPGARGHHGGAVVLGFGRAGAPGRRRPRAPARGRRPGSTDAACCALRMTAASAGGIA